MPSYEDLCLLKYDKIRPHRNRCREWTLHHVIRRFMSIPRRITLFTPDQYRTRLPSLLVCLRRALVDADLLIICGASDYLARVAKTQAVLISLVPSPHVENTHSLAGLALRPLPPIPIQAGQLHDDVLPTQVDASRISPVTDPRKTLQLPGHHETPTVCKKGMFSIRRNSLITVLPRISEETARLSKQGSAASELDLTDASSNSFRSANEDFPYRSESDVCF